MARKQGGRSEGGRSAKPVVLVVCEGETEFHYMNFIRGKYRASWLEPRLSDQSEPMGIIGCAFTDLVHEGKIERTDIVNIADIITGKVPGRTSDDQTIIYSVGGMPVEDIAWGGTVYRNAVEKGIGVKLNLWDTPEMA